MLSTPAPNDPASLPLYLQTSDIQWRIPSIYMRLRLLFAPPIEGYLRKNKLLIIKQIVKLKPFYYYQDSKLGTEK